MALMINELLCFLSTQSDKLDRKNISTVLSDFYSLDEAVTAKDILVSECDLLSISSEISQFKKSRKNGNEPAIFKVIKDILDIWDVIDTAKAGVTSRQFVAGDPNRLPQVNAEKYNLKFLISSILCLQEQVSSITNLVTGVEKRNESSALNESTPNDQFSQPSLSPSLPLRTFVCTPPVFDQEDVLFPSEISTQKSLFPAKNSKSADLGITSKSSPALVSTSIPTTASASTSSTATSASASNLSSSVTS